MLWGFFRMNNEELLEKIKLVIKNFNDGWESGRKERDEEALRVLRKENKKYSKLWEQYEQDNDKEGITMCQYVIAEIFQIARELGFKEEKLDEETQIEKALREKNGSR